MPIYDFKCESCGEEINEIIKWSETLCEDLKPCKCGEKNWKRLIKISYGKFKEPSADLATRQTEEMLSGKNWY